MRYAPQGSLRGLLRGLIGDVRTLVAGGQLSSRQAARLTARLAGAMGDITAGRLGSARRRLEAFRSRVDALAAAGLLPPDRAGALATAAAEVLARLDC